MKGKVKTGAVVALGLTLLPLIALAQIGQVPGPIITSPTDIANLVQRILNWFAGIVMTFSLVILLYAAVLYLTAGAAPSQLDKAKNALTYAIIGIVVAIIAFSIQPFIQNVLRGGF